MTLLAAVPTTPPDPPAPEPPPRRRGRRLPLTLVVALAVLVAAEGATRVVAADLPEPLRWHNWEAQNKVAQMDAFADAGRRASVVLVGSSMVNAAVDPVVLTKAAGLDDPAYNAALNGASARIVARWTLDVVVPKLQPEAVVVGVSSRDINDGGTFQRDRYAEFAASPAAAEATGDAGLLDRLEAEITRRSALVRHRETLRHPTRIWGDRPRPGSAVGPLGTLRAVSIFEDAEYRNTADFLRRTRDEDLVDYRAGGPELAALRRLVDGLVERDIDVVLVAMPITDDAVALHPRGQRDYEAFQDAFDRLGATPGVTALDVGDRYNGTAPFFDAMHLNGTGRHDFTAFLAGELAPRGD